MKTKKVVIIGAGHVGSHAGYALVMQGLVSHIVYIDVDGAKARAQALDLEDAVSYLRHRVHISAGDYSDAKDADLLIVAAGPLPDLSKGETRMDSLKKTVSIVKEVVEHIRASGFSGIILNISNPADVVTNYIQRRLDYPAHKVLSTSTMLDSARLRRALSEKLSIDPRSFCVYVLGEHGESQMVAWSAATVAGKSLSVYLKEHANIFGNLDLVALAKEARGGGWTILEGKGSTEFGIGASIAEVTRAIFWDERRVLPVATLLRGEYGQQDVFASVPAIVGIDGVSEIIELSLNSEEQKAFAASCKTMKDNCTLALSL
ncbi:MAG: L-lactate dehydrogenase [Deltaproteobacteria bacterium]|jgi:L-lactate dehydrogenase|nr:L-lactate dehydrogenase [Deltaproteobacteria bacterium]